MWSNSLNNSPRCLTSARAVLRRACPPQDRSRADPSKGKTYGAQRSLEPRGAVNDTGLLTTNALTHQEGRVHTAPQSHLSLPKFLRILHRTRGELDPGKNRWAGEEVEQIRAPRNLQIPELVEPCSPVWVPMCFVRSLDCVKAWCMCRGGRRNGCACVPSGCHSARRSCRMWCRRRGGHRNGCARVSTGLLTARRPCHRWCTQRRAYPPPRPAPACAAQHGHHLLRRQKAAPFPALPRPSQDQPARLAPSRVRF